MLGKTLSETILETAKDFHDAGVMSEQTMREFDAKSLPSIKKYTPNQIKRIRRRFKVSQSVFALYLNTTTSTIQKWEQGQKKPNGIALKLLSLVDHHGLAVLAI
ncbi:MAG: transcriptional regulator [Gammaproteobacteria bacterium CG_4_10_14_0_8_um_filter_38_16]|nr:MAG: transcriptional regulator [Gammaproteobacteria bacterium CG_4_10_14_0_8_um_filter_38_16]PJA03571.1 MAG: transcriptional regulator [Gammaproteobacteria bacterium CG_4_10_14_0_2_um_filter_38_22]PJB10140.1 MAG: transcriptional regulator [Gammaproteobacteria bacterium CG_4_9_14_3_um_filter_38_9]